MDQEAPTGRIVVGVDGSEASIEALKRAQNLAVPLGAQVIATAYWEPSGAQDRPPSPMMPFRTALRIVRRRTEKNRGSNMSPGTRTAVLLMPSDVGFRIQVVASDPSRVARFEGAKGQPYRVPEV